MPGFCFICLSLPLSVVCYFCPWKLHENFNSVASVYWFFCFFFKPKWVPDTYKIWFYSPFILPTYILLSTYWSNSFDPKLPASRLYAHGIRSQSLFWEAWLYSYEHFSVSHTNCRDVPSLWRVPHFCGHWVPYSVTPLEMYPSRLRWKLFYNWIWKTEFAAVWVWGKCGRCVGLTTLSLNVPIVMKYGNLSLLEPSGPVQACSGFASPLHKYFTLKDRFFLNISLCEWEEQLNKCCRLTSSRYVDVLVCLWMCGQCNNMLLFEWNTKPVNTFDYKTY